jgi:hypothetical protein
MAAALVLARIWTKVSSNLAIPGLDPERQLDLQIGIVLTEKTVGSSPPNGKVG